MQGFCSGSSCFSANIFFLNNLTSFESIKLTNFILRIIRLHKHKYTAFAKKPPAFLGKYLQNLLS